MAHRQVAFETERGEEYYEDDITRLLASNDPGDKQKLNDIIVQAVDDDDTEPLEYLLRKGYKIGKINDSGATFLHQAFYKASSEILSDDGIELWLPHVTEEVVNIADSNGLTLLHIACSSTEGGQLIDKCLDCNANANAIFHRDPAEVERDGFTPLHFAAINVEGSYAIQRLVRRNADLNARDSRGRTPLHVACRIFEDPDDREASGGYVDNVDACICSETDVNARDNDGNTPMLSLFPDSYDDFKPDGLEHVEKVPVRETMRKLIILLNLLADVTLSNKRGDTLLHLIIKNLGYARRLYERARMSHAFADSDHAEMIEWVFTFSPTEFDFNVENHEGETPLQLAIRYLSVNVVGNLMDRLDTSPKNLDEEYFGCLLSHRTADVVPQLDDALNFSRVIELFAKRGFELDSERNLGVLAYLVHGDCEGECGFLEVYGHGKVGSSNLVQIVDYGSSLHFREVYARLGGEFSGIARITKKMFKMVVDNLKIRKYCKFYVDSALLSDFFRTRRLNVPLPKDKSMELERELDRMKSRKMKDNVTLYDVMTRHPHKIHRYVKDDYSAGQCYKLCKDIVEGHLMKAFVRHYVEKTTFEFLEDLLPPSCPNLCCKIIMDYLSNKDMWNVGRAVINV